MGSRTHKQLLVGTRTQLYVQLHGSKNIVIIMLWHIEAHSSGRLDSWSYQDIIDLQ